MADMRLSAIAIDDLRNLFSGNADAGQRLRQLASAAFPRRPLPRGAACCTSWAGHC